ncbi:hypothetical protein [Streptomyces sp. E2N166]|uniref:hypothetical protein n=1 Tax=Streptomyces sp. E2N166 TaxID=1851909 RepID=UPI00187D4CF5|nr:hypothetical protein [Streptomyces sp. E2N166]
MITALATLRRWASARAGEGAALAEIVEQVLGLDQFLLQSLGDLADEFKTIG